MLSQGLSLHHTEHLFSQSLMCSLSVSLSLSLSVSVSRSVLCVVFFFFFEAISNDAQGRLLTICRGPSSVQGIGLGSICTINRVYYLQPPKATIVKTWRKPRKAGIMLHII